MTLGIKNVEALDESSPKVYIGNESPEESKSSRSVELNGRCRITAVGEIGLALGLLSKVDWNWMSELKVPGPELELLLAGGFIGARAPRFLGAGTRFFPAAAGFPTPPTCGMLSGGFGAGTATLGWRFGGGTGAGTGTLGWRFGG